MFEDIMYNLLIELEIQYYAEIIEENKLINEESQDIFHNTLLEVCNPQESHEVAQILHNFLLSKNCIIHPTSDTCILSNHC